MDKRDLLAEFKKQLDEFDKFQTFIEKAKSASGKFTPAVVAKVVADNTAKIKGVISVLDPLVAELKGAVKGIKTERSSVEAGASNARLGLEELELRKEIGEIDDASFASESAGFRGEIDNANARVAELDADLAELQSTLDRWVAARPVGEETEPLPAPAPAPAPAPVVVEEDEDVVSVDDDDADAFADVGGRGGGAGVHAERVSVKDDVSVVFEAAEESGAIEAPEEGFGDDDLGDLGDMQSDVGPTPGSGDAELVMNEGTADEVVFRFGADGVISLGRGRDNTVQVKNDSKVSRLHCKVTRRDGAFYVEDNKSANGTLVDGELITEKRLRGGEEIIVGETYFRFRVK